MSPRDYLEEKYGIIYADIFTANGNPIKKSVRIIAPQLRQLIEDPLISHEELDTLGHALSLAMDYKNFEFECDIKGMLPSCFGGETIFFLYEKRFQDCITENRIDDFFDKVALTAPFKNIFFDEQVYLAFQDSHWDRLSDRDYPDELKEILRAEKGRNRTSSDYSRFWDAIEPFAFNERNSLLCGYTGRQFVAVPRDEVPSIRGLSSYHEYMKAVSQWPRVQIHRSFMDDFVSRIATDDLMVFGRNRVFDQWWRAYTDPRVLTDFDAALADFCRGEMHEKFWMRISDAASLSPDSQIGMDNRDFRHKLVELYTNALRDDCVVYIGQLDAFEAGGRVLGLPSK